jgi:hypothetical protein
VVLAGAIVSFAIAFVIGCGEKGPVEVRREAVSQEAMLKSRAEQAEKEKEQLKKQVETLSQLPVGKRAEAVYSLKEVKIGRFTNLYDEDKNGTKETLIVYVQPIDETGDVIKAAGAAEVQLWDLNKSNGEALLSKWSVEPNELKTKWFDSLAMTGYRLTYAASSLVGKFDRPLTVKITFTDYLSGKVFTDQKAIKP